VQLQIPKAPRRVKLSQVPGALARLFGVGVLALAAAAVVAFVVLRANRWLGAEADFFARAVEVEAKVMSVSLPRLEDRTRVPASLTAIYQFDGLDRSVSGVLVDAERGEGLGLGAKVTLLVDPRAPESPRELEYAQAQNALTRMGPAAVGLSLLIALMLMGFELRRAVRSELAPLRNGMLVWLTCEGGLPDTRAETTFAAHYFQADVKHQVRARARPGRAPVKNGEKVLAAVVPSRPTWVRVIDEDLARTLGWFA
jgi:hypothetical protein